MQELDAEGISVELLDARSICPLDLETIVASVRKTHRLVVAHEAVETGGAGAEIAAKVQEAAFDVLDSPVVRVGAAFAPVPASPVLEKDENKLSNSSRSCSSSGGLKRHCSRFPSLECRSATFISI
jgi:pyruvate dehydrogenase E1 component beta subunit